MTSARALIGVSAIVAAILVAQACAKTSTRPVSRLGALVGAYDREVTPYHPFTASEAGVRQYDRVLANNIGEEYRTGLTALCSRYRTELRRIDAATLDERERVTRDIFEFNLDACLERLRLPWHLLPIDQVGRSLPSEFAVIGAGRGVRRSATWPGPVRRSATRSASSRSWTFGGRPRRRWAHRSTCVISTTRCSRTAGCR